MLIQNLSYYSELDEEDLELRGGSGSIEYPNNFVYAYVNPHNANSYAGASAYLEGKPVKTYATSYTKRTDTGSALGGVAAGVMAYSGVDKDGKLVAKLDADLDAKLVV